MVDLDPAKLLAKGLTPLDVANAVNAQNLTLPSGTAKIGSTEYNIGLNGTPSVVDALNQRTNPIALTKIRKLVEAFAEGFPLYPERRHRNLAGVRV